MYVYAVCGDAKDGGRNKVVERKVAIAVASADLIRNAIFASARLKNSAQRHDNAAPLFFVRGLRPRI